MGELIDSVPTRIQMKSAETTKANPLVDERNILDDAAIDVQNAFRLDEEHDNGKQQRHGQINQMVSSNYVGGSPDNVARGNDEVYHDTLLEDSLNEFQTESPVSLSTYDLKDEESKFRRWTPKLDLYLVKLLSDVVHSFKKPENAELSKRAWSYITGLLRKANPQTVYATYTKYLILQHLFNVIHARYRMWHLLMEFKHSNHSEVEYSYRWSPELGKFQIFEISTNSVIIPDRQIKAVLFGDSFPLPSFKQFHKAGLVLNDLFLTNNLKYISVYHNEVLPMLVRLDSRYNENLPPLFSIIPKFHYEEEDKPFFKPLILPKPKQDITKERFRNRAIRKLKDTSPALTHQDLSISGLAHVLGNLHNDSETAVAVAAASAAINVGSAELDLKYGVQTQTNESVDPSLKRDGAHLNSSTIKSSSSMDVNCNVPTDNLSDQTSDFENALATAAITAMNTTSEAKSRDLMGYVKDRVWLNRLLSLCDRGMVSVNEVLAVCSGIRDGKIPPFMLNILDPGYLGSKADEEEDLSDSEVTKRIREFLLPMTYN